MYKFPIFLFALQNSVYGYVTAVNSNHLELNTRNNGIKISNKGANAREKLEGKRVQHLKYKRGERIQLN